MGGDSSLKNLDQGQCKVLMTRRQNPEPKTLAQTLQRPKTVNQAHLSRSSPDVGGVARARELATRIGAPLAIVDKRREKAGEVSGMTVIGDVKGHKCIIVDDICDTAGTLCKAAETLMEAGATEVHSYITHGVLSGPAVERVEKSVMKSLVITDSIEASASVKAAKNIRIVPTAPMFAQAILNIWGGMSVSSLFETDTLVPIYEGLYQRS